MKKSKVQQRKGARTPRRKREAMEAKRACRLCGCTNDQPCSTLEGPCRWVEPDLCSGCDAPPQLYPHTVETLLRVARSALGRMMIARKAKEVSIRMQDFGGAALYRNREKLYRRQTVEGR